MKKKMLVLGHRAELLDQACDKIRRANPDQRVEVEQAGRSAAWPTPRLLVKNGCTIKRKSTE